MRIAVDAMGGDDAPRRRRRRAGRARALRSRRRAGRPRRRDRRASSRAHADWSIARASRSSTPPTSSAMAESPAAALRRKPRASIHVAAELVARGEAAALFSAGHTGATVMAAHGAFGMLPRRRSAGAGGDDSDARAAGGPARRRARASSAGRSTCCSSRVMGSVVRAGGVRHRAPRVGLLSIGEEATQGQRADARGAPAAEGVAARLHRQRRGARRLQRRRRRDRLRRVHRQRRAEDQRRPRRDGRGLLGEELRARSRAGRIAADAPGVPAFRRRVDYSEYGGAPLLGVAGVAIVGHGRSTRQGGAQRGRHGVPLRGRPTSSQRVEQDIARRAVASHS